MKKLAFVVCLIMLMSIFCGCGQTVSREPQGSGPEDDSAGNAVESAPGENQNTGSEAVTIHNFNRTTTYEEAPERAVVLSYSIAEVMAALGLEDNVIALAPSMYTFEQVLPEYQDILRHRLAASQSTAQIIVGS